MLIADTFENRPLSIRQAVERARTRYADPSSDDIEVDDMAPVSPSDHGVWVQAWVHVRTEELAESTEE
jgi:hypothetical protein